LNHQNGAESKPVLAKSVGIILAMRQTQDRKVFKTACFAAQQELEELQWWREGTGGDSLVFGMFLSQSTLLH